MRSSLLILAAVGVLVACSSQPDAVSSSPPTVSYRLTGNDTTSTNALAAEYCRQYGMASQYDGLQASGAENVVQYTCVAGR